MSEPPDPDRLSRQVDAASRVGRWRPHSRRSRLIRQLQARRRTPGPALIPGADASLRTLLDSVPSRRDEPAEKPLTRGSAQPSK
jgi:hypothetical protein